MDLQTVLKLWLVLRDRKGGALKVSRRTAAKYFGPEATPQLIGRCPGSGSLV